MCVDREGLASVVEAVIMDEVDVVYSDHVAVCVSIEWKVKKKIQQKKKSKYVWLCRDSNHGPLANPGECSTIELHMIIINLILYE